MRLFHREQSEVKVFSSEELIEKVLPNSRFSGCIWNAYGCCMIRCFFGPAHERGTGFQGVARLGEVHEDCCQKATKTWDDLGKWLITTETPTTKTHR